MLKPADRVYVAGHSGLVGSAILRALEARGYQDVLTRTRTELDLTRQADVEEWFAGQRIDAVFLAAAKVGGIHANDTYRGEFIYQNLMIQSNVVHAAHKAGVERLVFLGSSCIYPRDCPQPMREEYLLTGPLESTNEPYAIAKIAGVKLCESYNRQYGRQYISLMPTNLYGPNDNFDLNTSHVIPAMIRKIHEAHLARAEYVTLWGSGNPKREFLHVDDLAEACIFLAEQDSCPSLINVGSGMEVTIRRLAEQISGIVGFTGELKFDTSMPDGTPRKLLDSSRVRALGWSPAISLAEGLEATYRWYLSAVVE